MTDTATKETAMADQTATDRLPRLLRVRLAVRAVLILGLVVSVIANILHANGNPISQTIAAWPPLALLLTIELISRVPAHRRWLAVVRLLAAAAIAGIAAWISYWHMAGVAARYGEVGASPFLEPLTVDGLVIVASVSLVELAGRIRSASEATTDQTTPVARPVGVPAAPVAVPTDRPADRAVASGANGTRPVAPAIADRPTDRLGDQGAVALAEQHEHEATTSTDHPIATAPTAPVDEVTDQPTTVRSLHLVGIPAAVVNAGLLRGRYGDDLPASGRQIRADMGWSKERVDRAVDAYNDRLDLATTDQADQSDDEVKENVS